MMGERRVRQEALFHGSSLEEHVPADHPLRAIDRFVESSEIRRQLEPFYSAIGRPSVDPEPTLRMLLTGCCCGIRSERRLREEVHLNLAYGWFCRLGLEGRVPDHPTFSKDRHGRFRDSDLLRRLFEATARRRMAEGIVGGEGFVADAGMVRADASRQKGVASSAELDPEDASRAATECLAVLEDAAFGAATDVPPKFASPTDPAARWTAAAGGPACRASRDNHLVDVEHAAVVDAEASTAVRQAEAGAARTMLTRAAEIFGLWPERLIAGTGCGSAAMPGWPVHEQGIEPRVPVFDKQAAAQRRHLQPLRLRLRPPARPLRLPGRQGTPASPPPVRAAAPRCRSRRPHALPRRQARLRRLRAEAPLLPEAPCPQGPALDPRGRARHGAGHRRDRGLRGLEARAEEGRDAVRAPQAHPPTGPLAAARPARRPRRVPPRRRRPEPPQARRADPAAATSARRLRVEDRDRHRTRRCGLDPPGSATQLLQRNRPIPETQTDIARPREPLPHVFMLCSKALPEGRPMRHLTLDRVARSSGPGPARPDDPRIAPLPRTEPPTSAGKGFVRSHPGPAASIPSGFVRTAPKPPPDRVDLPAPATPPPRAKRGHPLRICPIARRRAGQPPPNPPDRARRPRRTPICPIALPPAPFAPSGICPIALPTRDARRLRAVRARCNGGIRPTHERPMTPPNARARCRPDLRAPERPCPLAP
jgi:transposase